MKALPCCKFPSRSAPLRRGAETAGILLSGATLVLMPKCPMCIAAYVAVISGVSLSITTAAHLRTVLLVLCSAVLLALGWKIFLGLTGHKQSHNRSIISRREIVTPP